MRRAWVSAVLVAGTLAAGLAVRYGRVGLPGWVVKYGGSLLWAVLVYWIVSGAVRWRTPALAAVVSGVVATAVEFLKLYHAPGLDRFRLTLAGALLLGRFFSWTDVAVYWFGIVLAASAEALVRRRRPGLLA